MAVRTKEQLKAYFNRLDKPTEDQFSDLIDTIFSREEKKDKIYEFYISQNGTDPPTAEIIHNDLDGVATLSYISTGKYAGCLPGAFVSGKSRLYITPNPNTIGFPGLGEVVYVAGIDSADTFYIYTYLRDTAGNAVLSNNILYGNGYTSILIKVKI